MITKQEATTKWWYRLLKVIFILSVLWSLVIPVTVFISNTPEFNQYNSRFSLKCDDGRIRGDFNGSNVKKVLGENYLFDYYSTDSLKKIIDSSKVACAYNETDEDFQTLIKSGNFLVPKEINYKIVLTKAEYYGSWTEAIGYTLISIVGIIIFFSLVRAVFLYVIFGEKFWANLISIFRQFKWFINNANKNDTR